jgi:hypothetical protein
MMTEIKVKTQTPKFIIGDMVHIPQDVLLWSVHGSSKTKAPTTGVILDELSDSVVIFVHGRRMSASKKHVYPYKEEYNEGN